MSAAYLPQGYFTDTYFCQWWFSLTNLPLEITPEEATVITGVVEPLVWSSLSIYPTPAEVWSDTSGLVVGIGDYKRYIVLATYASRDVLVETRGGSTLMDSMVTVEHLIETPVSQDVEVETLRPEPNTEAKL
jgi:hypothetical protein